MEKLQATGSDRQPTGSVDIVLVEREARRLRAQYLAALMRSAAESIRRALARRAPTDFGQSARPSLG